MNKGVKFCRYRGLVQVETSSQAVAGTLLNPMRKGVRYASDAYGKFPMLISPVSTHPLALPAIRKKALGVAGEIVDAQKRLKCEQGNKVVLLVIDTQTGRDTKESVWPQPVKGHSPIVLQSPFQITSVRTTYKDEKEHLFYQAVAFELALMKNAGTEDMLRFQRQLEILVKDEPVGAVFQTFTR